MPIQLIPNELSGAKIKVVGVGGGGGNIINSMVDKGIEGVEFIAINTDKQALDMSKADVKIQIGKNVTKGLGTGMKNDIGEKAAEESREEIARELSGSDMVFITAGMGGGTGTGASPVVAKIAQSLEILTIAVITKPFQFEGKPRMNMAEIGVSKLIKEVDSIIIIPNQRILDLMPEKCTKNQAFAMANRVLYNATKGISQIITKTGEINVDFEDIKTTMKCTGDAMIGTGIASGEGRAEKAVADALSNPVLEDISIEGAKNVLVNIASNGDILMSEINDINMSIYKTAGDKTKFIFGVLDDPDMDSEIMVTLIATGFKKQNLESIGVPEQLAEITNMEEEYSESIGRITSLPETTKDLKKLDVPAFERRNKNIVNDDLSDTPKTKKDNLNIKYGLDDDMNLKNTEPPSFLRRTMD